MSPVVALGQKLLSWYGADFWIWNDLLSLKLAKLLLVPVFDLHLGY